MGARLKLLLEQNKLETIFLFISILIFLVFQLILPIMVGGIMRFSYWDFALLVLVIIALYFQKYFAHTLIIFLLIWMIGIRPSFTTTIRFILPIDIEVIPLTFFLTLAISKKEEISEILRGFIGNSDEDLENSSKALKRKFKKQFASLSETEIDRKLELDLVPEALEALREIKEELKAS